MGVLPLRTLPRWVIKKIQQKNNYHLNKLKLLIYIFYINFLQKINGVDTQKPNMLLYYIAQ